MFKRLKMSLICHQENEIDRTKFSLLTGLATTLIVSAEDHAKMIRFFADGTIL